MFDKTLCTTAAIGFLPMMVSDWRGVWIVKSADAEAVFLAFVKVTEHPWRSEQSHANVAQTKYGISGR